MSITLNAGSGGAALNTDNVAGVETQVAKLAHGAAGSATLVSTASGLPVQQQGAWTVGLPAGASTAAKQPALGTAGSASADVISVQGVASMTALKTDGSGVTQPVSGTFWQATQPVSNAGTFAVQAAVADGASVTLGAKADAKSTATDVTAVSAMSVLKQISASVQAPPSQAVTNAGTFATQAAATEADGANVTLGAKADAKSTATDTTAVTAMSVLKQISASVQAPPSQAVTNAGTFAVQAGNLPTTVDTNSGVKSASTLRVVLATDQPALTNKLLVTPDSVALPANQSVNVAQVNGVTTLMGNGVTGTGSQRVTIASDNTAFSVNAVESGTWTVQPGNTANTTPWLTTQIPATSGGLSISRTLSAANTTGISAKGSAGQVYGWVITNTNASARFVKFYNKATAPTVGTDTPVMTLPIPGNATGAGMVAAEFTSGIAFATGIGYGITGAVGDADTTAPAANEVVVNLLYK